jgi:hypothetical protein
MESWEKENGHGLGRVPINLLREEKRWKTLLKKVKMI